MNSSFIARGVTALLLLLSTSTIAQSSEETTLLKEVVDSNEESAISLTEEELKAQQYFQWVEEFEASLNYQTGEIALPGGKASLSVPEDYYYLSPQDTKRVLEEAWGNPEGELTLGMLFPQEYRVLDSASWGVTIEYANDGYVSDEDAGDIDYDDLLSNMQADTREENKLQAVFSDAACIF